MKWKKLAAPIVITVLLLIYFAAYLIGFSKEPMPIWGKLLSIIIPLGFMGVSIYVLVERIKEIRSGEEDDLSKY